jgi:hypothetical protein
VPVASYDPPTFGRVEYFVKYSPKMSADRFVAVKGKITTGL